MGTATIFFLKEIFVFLYLDRWKLHPLVRRPFIE